MPWRAVENLLDGGNRQTDNAANAGDGPKHMACLTFISVLGTWLKTFVGTHPGGGIYEVGAIDRASGCQGNRSWATTRGSLSHPRRPKGRRSSATAGRPRRGQGLLRHRTHSVRRVRYLYRTCRPKAWKTQRSRGVDVVRARAVGLLCSRRSSGAMSAWVRALTCPTTGSK